jgi:hypothetical protein
MNYNELILDHYNFFCPATGVQILGEEHCDETAKSLKAHWVCEALDEPVINDPKLEEAWAQYSKKFESENEDETVGAEELESFLRNYSAPNWSVFEIITRSMSCGPISSTVWLVVDLNTELDEEEGTDD